MKPFSPKTLLLFSPSSSSRFPSPLFIQISHFVTSQNQPPSSSTVSPYRRHEEDSKTVKVSVWWDFENCGVPAGASALKVSHNIFAAVRANGIKGSIQITAFGDMLQLSRAHQESLSASGISLTHIPRDAGRKNSAGRSLLVDLMYWVSENPPPAHLFLISGDRGFSNILYRLRMKNYNILLASSDKTPGVLCGAATMMWDWQDLATGQNFAGKHFNRPPDGPYGSWYGYYKAPLEDPFPVTLQSACSEIETFESDSENNCRPVPETVLKEIRKIVRSYPNGIGITDLRAELAKTNVSVEKDLYGHKKFSRFIMSMPHILNVEDIGNGRYMIRGITKKSIEPVGLKSVSSTKANNGDRDVTNPLLYVTDNSISEPLDMKDKDQKKLLSAPKENVEKPSPEDQSGLEEVQRRSKPRKKIVEVFDEQLADAKCSSGITFEKTDDENKCLKSTNLNVMGDNPVPSSSIDNISDGDKVAVTNPDSYNDRSSIILGFFNQIGKWYQSSKSSNSISKPLDMKDEDQNLKTKEACAVDKSVANAVVEKELLSTPKAKREKPSPEEQLRLEVQGTSKPCKKIVEVFDKQSTDAKCSSSNTSGKTDSENKCIHLVPSSSVNNFSDGDKVVAKSPESHNDASTINSGLFNQVVKWGWSWKSSNTADTLSEQADERQNDISRYSGGSELFAMDSFWSNMEAFVKTARGSGVISQSITREELAHNLQKDGPADLSSVSESDLLHLVDLLISEKKWVEESSSQTSPFKVVQTIGNSTHVARPNGSNELSSLFKTKPSPQKIPRTGSASQPLGRPKGKVLEDCEKLVNEILEKHPEGYNIGFFRKRFLTTYGYSFDCRELGHDKLPSLLQTLPGVKVESTFMFPSGQSSEDYSPHIAVSNIRVKGSNNRSGDLDCDLSHLSANDDMVRGLWEELGPVANTRESELKKTAVEAPMRRGADGDYELSLSDDSDLEDDTRTYGGAVVGKAKRPSGGEDSLFLQILGSWDSKEGGKKCQDKAETVDGMVDCSRTDRKQKLQRTYAFVKNDNAIGEVVGTLLKPRSVKNG